jgi:hypothetical protein
MKRMIVVLIAMFAISTAMAQEDPPSDEAVRELIAIVESRALLEAAAKEFDGLLKKSLRETLGGAAPTPAQEAIFDEYQEKLRVIRQEELSWEAIEAQYVAIYRNLLSQGEVSDLLEFYQTDLGRVVLEKMPRVQKRTTKALQDRILLMIPEIEKLQNEMRAQLEATLDE